MLHKAWALSVNSCKSASFVQPQTQVEPRQSCRPWLRIGPLGWPGWPARIAIGPAGGPPTQRLRCAVGTNIEPPKKYAVFLILVTAPVTCQMPGAP